MPAAPEIIDGAGNVGVVEVLQEMEAKHAPQADGHVRIAGKIKVDLQRVGSHPQPGRGGGKVAQGEDVIRDQAHIVRQQHLLPKAEDEARHPLHHVPAALPAPVDLPRHRLIAHDGAGDQLGKEGYVEPEIQHVMLHGGPAPVDIQHVGHDLEGEEGDAMGSAISRLNALPSRRPHAARRSSDT